ncbi:Putative membrane protein [Corynebacterium camporealensis]|uniref:Putative membrane protein n=1 Tax=Corynebacterium camporealensis TaxID=161896 RepID=A0A0F6QW09_9CORY|nr:DUF485 domain-containing protein [Corynebacterium camporealensis]AKE38690.1 putative membrane protein [Corynebacterium camporealensis]AVH87972.1 Putative membrane protein [Corynebacterium camporealensis]
MAGANATPQSKREPTADDFIAMRDSEQFADLRSTYRKFAFPMTVAFFVWYIVYVLAAVFAPDFMAIEVFGGWNVGFLFGLAQFATTFIITWIYVKYANKNIEPKSAAIREELEG